MRVQFAQSSFKGDRNYNEDFAKCVNEKNRFCFSLADGLGGHGKGDIASKLVCTSVSDLFMNGCYNLDEIFIGTQNALLNKQKDCI